MPCDTRRRVNQTLEQRKEEIRQVVSNLEKLLIARQVQVRIDKQTGAIAFANWAEGEFKGVTDACAYRRIMATGSAMAKMEIAKAEQLAGRTVNKQALAQGVHSHDGGNTWHHGH